MFRHPLSYVQPMPQGKLISSLAPESEFYWYKDNLISVANDLVKEEIIVVPWFEMNGFLILPLHVGGSYLGKLENDNIMRFF